MALRQVYDDNGTLKSKDIAGSGSANAADTAYDNSNTGLPANVQGALDKTTCNITALDTVELTATAAHAHAVGSTFLWIGQLVKATTAIAVGDTIAVGTNVKETDICSVLDEVNSKTIFVEIIISQIGGNEVIIPDGYDTILSVMYENTDNGLWYLETDQSKVTPLVNTLNNSVSLYCIQIPYYPRYKVTLTKS